VQPVKEVITQVWCHPIKDQVIYTGPSTIFQGLYTNSCPRCINYFNLPGLLLSTKEFAQRYPYNLVGWWPLLSCLRSGTLTRSIARHIWVWGWFYLVQVSKYISGFGKFHPKKTNFQFFALRVKKFHQARSSNSWVKDELDLYIMWVRSMLESGLVRAYLYKGLSQHVLTFITDQQYGLNQVSHLRV